MKQLFILLLLLGCMSSCNKKKAIKFTTIPEKWIVKPTAPIVKPLTKLTKVEPVKIVSETKPLVYETVLFAFDSEELSELAIEQIEQFTTSVGKGQTIFLIGACDPIGTEEYNQFLGMRRGKSVYDVIHNILPEHTILIQSYGESDLVTENPEYYYKNRRCEMKARED